MHKILFSIANFGNSQLEYLVKLLESLATWENCTIKVVVDTTVDLSNYFPKSTELIAFEQRIFPESIGVRLPYKHRDLFVQNLGRFDWFFFSENDLLFHPKVIDFFAQKSKLLNSKDLIGFLRYEDFGSARYLTDFDFKTPLTNGLPWRENGYIWYTPSIMHSGCYLLSNAQLERAVSSGGYTNYAHRQPYGVLEQAASDIYTQCAYHGKIVPLQCDEVFVHHMPNKYINSINRMARHRVDILNELHQFVGIRDYWFDGSKPDFITMLYRIARFKFNELRNILRKKFNG